MTVKSDFSKSPGLSGQANMLQANVDRAFLLTKQNAITEAQAYSPADPSDWADPPPSTVAEALDRLAAANPGA